MKKFGIAFLAFVIIAAVVPDSYSLYPLFHIAAGFLLLCLIIWGITKLARPSQKKVEAIPVLTKEKENYYAGLGMSPSEVELFRDTMNNAKKQIDRIQKSIGKSSKLKAVDLRHDTLKAAKALFKELVKEPTRLHDASHFLYTHLPNMADLMDKYIEINDHEIKSKETFAKLEESTQIIDQLAILIVQDYQQFVAEDLDDLDVEISIAKQSVKRDNELKSEFK